MDCFIFSSEGCIEIAKIRDGIYRPLNSVILRDHIDIAKLASIIFNNLEIKYLLHLLHFSLKFLSF